jgi:hypothetical protein
MVQHGSCTCIFNNVVTDQSQVLNQIVEDIISVWRASKGVIFE